MIDKKVNIFISYAQEDEKIKEKLDGHLTALKRNEKIAVWHEGKLLGGTEYDEEKKKELDMADIIILLVSASFISSDYIWKKELPLVMERHESGKAFVIPVIARDVDWQGLPFNKLTPLPADGKAIESSRKKNEVLKNVSIEIRKIVEEILNQNVLKLKTFSNKTEEKFSNIFLSVPSPHNDIQSAYIEKLKQLMRSHKINLVTVDGNDWDDDDPIPPILTLMRTCSACIVLLLERYYVEQGKLKRGGKGEKQINSRAYTTPWCQIEATLAYSLDLDLLIMCDSNVENDGLFQDTITKFRHVKINSADLTEWETGDKKFILDTFIDKAKK